MAQRKGTITNPTDRAIGWHDTILYIVSALDLPRQRGLPNPVAILGVNGLKPGGRGPIKALAGMTPKGFVSRAYEKQLVLRRVAHPENFADVFGQLAELLVGFAQARLGRFTLGDVGVDL